ncbi:MAG TPA: AAA family ATPase [Candidatus Angelobacter sp.]|nr:AAA family ATPase [Candidatus Angelobacter sp.]
MLTRLQVSGFKNLVDVDVRLGPFTCIAGPNGVGKSNLFDAILFISALTDRTLTEAALSVRSESERTGDLQGIFHRVGVTRADRIRFEADMILPPSGVDELGQPVEGSSTFVRYSLVLGLRPESSPDQEAGLLELIEETLVPLRLTDATRHLLFPHSIEWRKSVLKGRHTAKFISTEEDGNQRTVRLHQDGRSGRLFKRPTTSLRRTLLSTVQAGEYPTAMLVRREMQSWRMLHLESSALRRPDPFTAPTKMTPEGAHLPAALNQLARHNGNGTNGRADNVKESAVLASVANRLAELIEDVREVRVDRDETRQLFTVQVTTRDGTIHPASALSDGTLRFLALAVTEFDRQSGGVLCFEEPENGIHPRRIHSMLRLLQDIATDTESPVDEDNPLRQVIINTHSPSVVLQTPEDSLLVAELAEGVRATDGQNKKPPVRFRQLLFSCLEGNWRQKVEGHRITGKGNLLAYLNPSAAERDSDVEKKRVMDRSDVQMLLTFPSGA